MRQRPIRVLELRSALGKGGGPEKTILLGSERTDPGHFAIKVCYLRDLRDEAFSIADRARGKVDYTEIHERHSFDPRIWRDLRRLVREGAFDIVHSHDYKTDFLVFFLARFENVIPLATAHGWIGGPRRQRLYDAVDRRLLARFPCVVAVSRHIREALLRAGAEPRRVRVILNAIDPEVFRRERSRESAARKHFGVESASPVLGAVGRLESEKRFDVLLEALAIVRRERRAARLLIAGNGTLLPDLRARATRLGLGSSVCFLGHVDDVVGLHHAIDLYVQSSEREGTPNAVLEAMALETPIVATDVGGTADLARDGEHALLVRANDAAALAAAILRALDDPEGSRQRAAAARRRVEGRSLLRRTHGRRRGDLRGACRELWTPQPVADGGAGMRNGIRDVAKKAAFWIATLVVAPQLVSYWLRSRILGPDRALEGSTQLLSLVPGVLGQYLRRAFLSRVLADFHPSVTIEFGTIFSKVGARLGENVYVGPGCHLGLVDIGRNVLLGAAVHVPSGPQTHGTDDPSRPIREQPGELRVVRIAAGAWIGSAAIVLADVGRDSVVAAGAVVTKPVPERVVAGGVPAQVLRHRESP